VSKYFKPKKLYLLYFMTQPTYRRK